MNNSNFPKALCRNFIWGVVLTDPPPHELLKNTPMFLAVLIKCKEVEPKSDKKIRSKLGLIFLELPFCTLDLIEIPHQSKPSLING